MASAKPWLAHYQPGVPAEIDPSIYNSLADLLDESFKKFARRDSAAFMGGRWTLEQFDEASKVMAEWLQ